jgi:RNA polymerase sigma factor (sigma-70 family)
MEELVLALQNNELKEAAFKKLVLQYQKPLYHHVRRYVACHEDADDILQNTFIKIWNAIESFRGECSLYSWLYRIAYNEAITYINKNKKHIGVDVGPEKLIEKMKTLPSDDAEYIQLKLDFAITQLPEKQKHVFILRYYDEMPYEKMSEILETSVGALKASYHHAVKKVEEIILNY